MPTRRRMRSRASASRKSTSACRRSTSRIPRYTCPPSTARPLPTAASSSRSLVSCPTAAATGVSSRRLSSLRSSRTATMCSTISSATSRTTTTTRAPRRTRHSLLRSSPCTTRRRPCRSLPRRCPHPLRPPQCRKPSPRPRSPRLRRPRRRSRPRRLPRTLLLPRPWHSSSRRRARRGPTWRRRAQASGHLHLRRPVASLLAASPPRRPPRLSQLRSLPPQVPVQSRRVPPKPGAPPAPCRLRRCS